MKKIRDGLTSNQEWAIQLLLEGKDISVVAQIIGCDRQTITRWTKKPLFRVRLSIEQEQMLAQTSYKFNTYVSKGYETLYKIAENEDDKYHVEFQLEAAIKLVELPFKNMEYLKLIEANRLELDKEYEGLYDENEDDDQVVSGSTSNITSVELDVGNVEVNVGNTENSDNADSYDTGFDSKDDDSDI